MLNKLKLLLTGLLLPVFLANAQVNTSSPYSRFGFGELRHPGFTSNLSMGGSGIALRIPNQVNYINPASYTSLDSLSFIFDFGLNASYTLYKTNLNESQLSNYNIDHIAISFPITSWWKSSIGITPFSSVGYNIKEQRLLPDIGLTDFYFIGSGGLSKFYIGNGFNLLKGLSVGFNLSYLFGNQNNAHSVHFTNDPYSAITELHNLLNIKGIIYDLGMQYSKTFSEKYIITLGVIYNTETKLKGTNNITNINRFPGNQFLTADSIVVNPIYLLNADTLKGKINYPHNIGFGLSLGIKDKLILTGEYSTQEWSKLSMMGKSDSLVNSNSMNVGLEFTPGNSGSVVKYINRIHYRIGGYYSNSYLRFQNNQIKDYAITLGLGFPFKNTKTTFNLGFIYGQRGALKNNLIKENYGIVSFSMTFHDFWFLKTVID
jgi:long-subunit fatty acid transport protein